MNENYNIQSYKRESEAKKTHIHFLKTKEGKISQEKLQKIISKIQHEEMPKEFLKPRCISKK
jgi:hypothetical protein